MAPDSAQIHTPHSRWLLVALLASGSIATMLTATTVNVALPSITGVFALGQDQAQWVSSAFLTASTACMLLNAWTVAAFGARASFLAALGVFSLGGVIGAASQSLETLVLGRVLQGAGAGLIQPLAMMLIFQAFPARQQGTAIGLYALGVIVSPAFGPVIGGVLIDLFDWRVTFVATIPLAVLAAGAAPFLLPGREGTGRAPPLDWIGLGLAVLAIALGLQGLAGGHRDGWDATITQARLGAAALFAGAFWLHARAAPHPILHLAVFAQPGFARASLMVGMTGLAVYGSTYLIPLYAQTIQHYPPTGAGQLLLPAGVAMAVAFPLAGRLSDRMDARWILGAGVGVFGLSMLLMANLDASTPFIAFAGWTALSRLGVGLLMPAANASAMRLSDPALIAHAAPALTFLTQTGGVAGIAGLAVLLQERTAMHAEHMRISLGDNAGQVSAYLETTGLPDPQALLHFAAHVGAAASLLAFRDCFAVLAGLFVVLLALVPAIPRSLAKT